MKIQAIVIASALACCTAFAAAPEDTSKTGGTDTAAPTAEKAPAKPAMKKHKVAHKAKKQAHHMASRKQTQHMGAAAAPQTDVNDNGRQARMDEALAKFRQGRS